MSTPEPAPNGLPWLTWLAEDPDNETGHATREDADAFAQKTLAAAPPDASPDHVVFVCEWAYDDDMGRYVYGTRAIYGVRDGQVVEVEDPGRFCGEPGLVWYAKNRKVAGADLKIGDWLDSLDHRGARMIWGIWIGDVDTADLSETMTSAGFHRAAKESRLLTVMFGFGDTETVRTDVEYDVVDPNSQVAPDGSPL